MPPKKRVTRVQRRFCYSFHYAESSRGRNPFENWFEMYVRLYRKSDGEAWCVRKAYSYPVLISKQAASKGPQNEGRKITYRDTARDFKAEIISKAEYETFKVFEGEGK